MGIISLITSNNIDEFHKQCWLKEARQKRVHVIWFSFYEVPKQAKLISDVRGHDSSCYSGNYWKRAQGGQWFLDAGNMLS